MGMNCRIQDFKYKDVVCMADGIRLGYVGDVEIDTQTARLTAVVICGRLRWLGLLGREEDIVIPWDDIQVIGEDTILVNYNPPGQLRRKRLFWGEGSRG